MVTGPWHCHVSCISENLLFFSLLGTCNWTQPLPPLPEIETVNHKDLGPVSPCDFVFDARVLFLSSILFKHSDLHFNEPTQLLLSDEAPLVRIIWWVQWRHAGLHNKQLCFTPFLDFFLYICRCLSGGLESSVLTLRFNIPIKHLHLELVFQC